MAVLLLIVVTVFYGFNGLQYLIASKQQEALRRNSESPISWIDMTQIVGWPDRIEYAIAKEGIKPADLNKLDFSQLGDPGFGSNPDWEFFNPKGRWHVGTKTGLALEPWLLQQISASNKPVVIFNLRRLVKDRGQLREAFFLIIPNVKKEECERYYNPHDDPKIKAVRHADKRIEIAPDARHIVIDVLSQEPLRGCIEEPDGMIDLFMPFYGHALK